jgi:serine/threonine protein kinase
MLKEKERFMSFLKNMMKIDPEERISAAQLMEEPWLQGV